MKLFRGLLPILLLLLAGCQGLSGGSPTPLPTVVLGSGGPTALAATPSAASGPAAVTASAEIVPARSADLGFASAGVVGEVKISEGDQVKAGDLLASLDSYSALQSAVDASQMALQNAQDGYAALVANAPVARASAELALAQAQKARDDANKAVQSKQFQRASPQTIDIARANLIVAQNALDDAETIYNQNKNRSSTDVVYAAALSQLAAAQQREQQAQYNLNYVSSLPDAVDIQIAQANLDLAEANLQAAIDSWNRVKDGPDPDLVAADQASIAAAQSALASAQSARDHAAIKAPFAGTVADLNAAAGETVVPGQAVLTLADLSDLQVETTDLSERDVDRVSLGQTATVSIPGLGKDVSGKVIHIASRATKEGGDVVYKVTIQLAEQPAGLRWGMSATVQISS